MRASLLAALLLLLLASSPAIAAGLSDPLPGRAVHPLATTIPAAALSVGVNYSPLQQPAITLRFSPAASQVEVGASTTVDLVADNAGDLYGVELYISFDSSRLSATRVSPGPFLPGAEVTSDAMDNGAGRVTYVASLLSNASAAGSSGVVARITFTGVAEGTAALSWSAVKLSDRDSRAIPPSLQSGALSVVPPVTREPTPTRTPQPTSVPEPEPTSTPRPVVDTPPAAAPEPAPASPASVSPGSSGNPAPAGGDSSLGGGGGLPGSSIPAVQAELELQCPVPLGLSMGPLTGVSVPASLPAGVPPLSSEGTCALLDPAPGVGLVRTSSGGSGVELRVDNQGAAMAVRFETLPSLPPGAVLPQAASVARVFSLDLFRYQPVDHTASKIVYGSASGSAPVVLRWQLGGEDFSRTVDQYGDAHPERLVFAWLAADGQAMKAPTSWCPFPAPYGTLSAVLADRPAYAGNSVFLLLVLPPEQEGLTMPADPQYFPQTGFRITNPAFWDFFNKRGGVRSFGYPISRQFTLLGFPVQLFQRGILQQFPSGAVGSMNLLDEGMMPYSRMNGSTFPLPDPELLNGAPSPGDPDYANKAVAFIDANVPGEWEGMAVNFRGAYLSTVRFEDAFPGGDGNPALLPLLNLELWGLPTSRPAVDPANYNFVYQRFQRGILHFDATSGATQGLLLGDYLRMVITGNGLPSDLESQVQGSRFYSQYSRDRQGHLARPDQLPGTNLVGAFEPDIPQELVASAVSVTALLLTFICVGTSLVGTRIQKRGGRRVGPGD